MPNYEARPTIYNGIQMRSRLEAGYAAWLDSEDIAWEYEPRVYASERGQYLPDFILSNVEVAMWQGIGPAMRTVVVETKPTREFWEETKPRMEVLIDAFGDNEAILVIDTPEGMLLRECCWGGRWVVGQWVDPLYGPPILAVFKFDRPWHGEWWKAIPSSTARAKVGSAVTVRDDDCPF